MAFEVQQGGEPQQVSGSTPLSQGSTPAATQPQEQSAQTQAPSTPATIQTGASVNQATSQGNAQNRSSGGASSGMFTNVQRYVERNRPQAQKMAQAVTQDFGKQADAIRQQADQQRQQQQQQVLANQAQMQQQMQEAQNIVGGVMGTTEQAAPQEDNQPNFDDQLARFQALSQGPVGVQQVSDLNLGQQANRARALANLAQGANRENFRRNLMSQAFDDRQYTRGQSALDNLIVGGDQAAREKIIQGTQGRAEALNQRLKDLGIQSSEDVATQIQAMRDFGGQVRGIATGAEGQVTTDLEDAYKNFLAERENFLVDEFGNVTSALDTRRQEILDRLAPTGEGKNAVLQRYAQLLQEGPVALGQRGDQVIGRLAREGFNFDPQVITGGGSGTTTYTPEYLQRIAENPFLDANRTLYDSLNYGTEADLGLMTGEEAAGNIWNTSRSSNRSKSDQFFKVDTLADTFQRAIDQQKNLDFNQQISDALAGVSGVSRDDLIAGTDVDKFDVADETQLQRFNRLQQLLGEEGDIVADEMRNKNFATADALSNVLNRYRMK